MLAQEESRLLDHNFIGTEHILLGLIREAEGVGAKALLSMGISLESVRHEVEEIIGHGNTEMSGHIPFTPRAKKVLELSLREALDLGHNYIGTEHILLGLIREGDGVGAKVLVKLGADLSRVRQTVNKLLAGDQPGLQGEQPGLQAEPRNRAPEPPRCPRCQAALADTAAYRIVEAKPSGPDSEAETLRIVIAYCTSCGTAMGTGS